MSKDADRPKRALVASLLAMKLRILHILVLFSIQFSGCSRLDRDYNYRLSGDYSLYRTSIYEIVIRSDSGQTSIPEMVIELAWNERYILAKQQLLKKRSNDPLDGYLVPDTGNYKFWIIDNSKKNVMGPLDEIEFDATRKLLKVPMDLKLMPAGHYAK